METTTEEEKKVVPAKSRKLFLIVANWKAILGASVKGEDMRSFFFVRNV